MPARLGDEHTEFAGASTVAGAVDQQDAPDIALSGGWCRRQRMCAHAVSQAELGESA